MPKNSAIIILICLILAGIGLRGYHLTARSLWFDEAFSWRLIQFPVPEMIARDAADVHPPLYYLALKSWATVFGASLLSLRSFSIAMSAAAIAFMYLFAAEAWRSRRAGIYAALFLTVSGWQIAFAWEARMYTMGTALSLLSAWLLLKAIRQKTQHLGWWLAYGVALAALAYTHYYALFTIAAQVIFLLGYVITHARGRVGEIIQSRLTWYAIISGAILAALFAPWLPTFLMQRSQVQASFWIPKIDKWSVPDTFYRMIAPTPFSPPHAGLGLLLDYAPITLAALGIIWLIVSCYHRQSKTKKQTFTNQLDASWLTVSCAIVPFVLSIAVSSTGQSVYQDRYFIFANLFFIAGAAGIISRIKTSKAATATALIIAAGLLGLFIQYWYQLDIKDKPGSHGATNYVFAHRTDNEPIYSSSPYVFFAVLHYSHEQYQDAAIPKLYSESGELSHFSGGPILTKADIIGPQLFQDPTIKSFWMIDTTGFGEKELKVTNDFTKKDHQVFPEIYDYQGQVIANHYVRR
jgi:uncharacterized membrane protein